MLIWNGSSEYYWRYRVDTILSTDGQTDRWTRWNQYITIEYDLNIYYLIPKPVTFPYTAYGIRNCSDNDFYGCNKRIIWTNYLSLWHLGDWCIIYVLGILEYGSIFVWYSSQYPLLQLLSITLASQNSPLKKIIEVYSMKYRQSFVVLRLWRGVFHII